MGSFGGFSSGFDDDFFKGGFGASSSFSSNSFGGGIGGTSKSVSTTTKTMYLIFYFRNGKTVTTKKTTITKQDGTK